MISAIPWNYKNDKLWQKQFLTWWRFVCFARAFICSNVFQLFLYQRLFDFKQIATVDNIPKLFPRLYLVSKCRPTSLLLRMAVLSSVWTHWSKPTCWRVTSNSLVCLSLLSLILAAASRFLCLLRFLLYSSSGPNSSSGRDGFRPGLVGPFGLPSELTEFIELIDVTEVT